MQSKPGCIAIVDVDARLRANLARSLRKEGFKARTFATAEDYLASDELTAIDVVLTEVRIDVVQNIELLVELARRGVETAIIFMTEESVQKTADQLEAIGLPRCLRKPFAASELSSAIRMALGDE